jgi:uncharacterized protein (TIGR03089 family)
MPLAATHPGHWVTLALVAGAWQAGAVVLPTSVEGAAVTVVGPDGLSAPLAGTVLACSLHPLGFGFTEPLPTGVIDFSVEVRSQPDAHVEVTLAESAGAWRDSATTFSHADLAASEPVSERVLVRPTTPLATLRAGYLEPLLGGGSAVIVLGDDEEAISRIVAEERVS